ncbi:MAG: restriction endonuclease [Rhizobiales bacterium]|nr:restriction endonuclease [Hyphomicrobiales bacterium]
MITQNEPATWQDLQTWTAQILNECGIQAQTEITLKSVRGEVEIDVLAIENVQGREHKVLVECKNWKAKVPKNVVHGFRTVVNDIGANVGYIISKAGFQSGAYEAAENTNIKLMTWWEFMEAFEDQWYWNHLPNQVYEQLDGLCSYLEPIPAMTAWDEYLDESDVERLREMYQQHCPLGMLIFALLPFNAMLPGKKERIRLPLGDCPGEYGNPPDSLIAQAGYREFFDELVKYSNPILTEFRSYRDKALARKVEAEQQD